MDTVPLGRKGSSEQRASRGAILKAELLRDISIQKWQTNQAYLLKSSTNAKTFVLLCVWIPVEELKRGKCSVTFCQD